MDCPLSLKLTLSKDCLAASYSGSSSSSSVSSLLFQSAASSSSIQTSVNIDNVIRTICSVYVGVRLHIAGETSAKVVRSSNDAILVADDNSLFLETIAQKSIIVGNMSLNILGASSTKSINFSRTEAKASSCPFCKNLGKELSKFGNKGDKLGHTFFGSSLKKATKAEQAAIRTSSFSSSKPDV